MISDAKIRAALDLEATDPTPQLLAAFRDRALGYIETQTGHFFGVPEETVEFLRGDGSRYLRLSDVGAVTQVLESAYPGGDQTALSGEGSGADFTAREASHTTYLVRLGSDGVWTADYEYEVHYTRGYLVDTGPKDIERLLLGIIGLAWRLQGNEGLRSETIGGYAWTRFGDGGLDSIDGAKETIDLWRRRVMG